MKVFGITFSTVEELAGWREEVGLKSDLLSDSTRAVGMAYGAADDASQAKAARLTFLIGKDGNIEQVFAPKDAAGHASEVVATL